jgi:hypothetical protein
VNVIESGANQLIESSTENSAVGYTRRLQIEVPQAEAVTVPAALTSVRVSNTRVPFCRTLVLDSMAALLVDVTVLVWLFEITTMTVPSIGGV